MPGYNEGFTDCSTPLSKTTPYSKLPKITLRNLEGWQWQSTSSSGKWISHVFNGDFPNLSQTLQPWFANNGLNRYGPSSFPSNSSESIELPCFRAATGWLFHNTSRTNPLGSPRQISRFSGEILEEGCSFFAYSWKLPAYSWAFSLTVVFGSFFCLQFELFCLQFELFLITVELLCWQWVSV